MLAVTPRTSPLVVLLLLSAAACSDGTGPARDDISGLYMLSGVIEESACQPASWPTGDWSSFEMPDVGDPAGAAWQVSRSASSISVTNVVPASLPDEEQWQFTAPLAPDMTFTFGPRTLIDGTVTTDAGTFDLLMDETVSGSIELAPTARITARHEITYAFTNAGASTMFTTCSVAVALTGTRAP